MCARFAAVAAASAVCVLGSFWILPGHTAESLTLAQAFGRVAGRHPELRLLGVQAEQVSAELDRAALRPALTAGMEIENALGTGEAAGVDRLELTLTLASVLERGGKLDARRLVAQSRFDALAVEREMRRLDLLAEVARRYLAVVAAQQMQQIAGEDIEHRKRTVQAAQRRFEAGASPESVVLGARATLARAELDLARAGQQLHSGRQHLAALWGERNPSFAVTVTDPLALPEVPAFAALADLLERTPELISFASERRIREARLQLARSQATPDLEWQVGVRRLQDTDDFALVGAVSLPLGSARRAQPDIRAASADLAALEVEREVKGLSLYSTLVEAHSRYMLARLEVSRLAADVLPQLEKAQAAAERAFSAGAIGYLEWSQLQSEHTAARKQQLDAALDAQRALIEIQRLTGDPFVTGQTS
jgi:cobalt-zinc-cadmium efflux system outer membrane protein